MVNVARPSYMCVLSLPVRQKKNKAKLKYNSFLTFEMMMAIVLGNFTVHKT